MGRKIKATLSEIIKIIKKPVMSILPGQLAFSFVLTIIPMVALVGIIATTFSISLDTITEFVSSFPDAVSNMLLPLINGRGFDISILIFLITAFWLSTGGAYSIITASDVIYENKNHEPIKKRIKSIVMTFILILLLIFMFVVPAFGDILMKLILNVIKVDSGTTEIMIVYYLIKYPLSFLLIYFGLKIIYTMAPNEEIKSKTVTTGALFTTIMWMIVTEIYSFWVGNVAHYDIFYGSISNIIILLIWMYILAYIFVIGLVMNAGIKREKKEKI